MRYPPVAHYRIALRHAHVSSVGSMGRRTFIVIPAKARIHGAAGETIGRK
jgi:hypothetical protein